jgi:hypothetical protein
MGPISPLTTRQGDPFSVANVPQVWELLYLLVGRTDQYIGSQILAKRELPHPKKPATHQPARSALISIALTLCAA